MVACGAGEALASPVLSALTELVALDMVSSDVELDDGVAFAVVNVPTENGTPEYRATV